MKKRTNTTTKDKNKPYKKRVYKKKETVDKKIEKALKQYGPEKQINMFYDNLVQRLGLNYNGGIGQAWGSVGLENLGVGTTPQSRLGNKINLLGIRLHYEISFPMAFLPISTAPIQSYFEQMTNKCKLVLLQLKEPYSSPGNFPYNAVKTEYTNAGAIWNDELLITGWGNNPTFRDRYNIVWQKEITVQQIAPLIDPVTSLVYPVAATYPNMVNGTKWIKGDKLSNVTWNSLLAATGTYHGGFILTTIAQYNAGGVLNYQPPTLNFGITYYFNP